MKYRIGAIFTIFVLIVISAFGILKRQTYTDISNMDNQLYELGVAELPEKIALPDCEQMLNELPNAPLIMHVHVVEEIEYLFKTSRQKVQIKEIFAGENLNVGDEIYITGRCSLSVSSEPKSIECDFINIPRIGQDYLIFAETQIDALNTEIPVYRLCSNSYIAPIFCYSDSPHIIFPTEGETTYVPYLKVKDNEFFAESELGFQTWNELKHKLLAMFPAKQK